MRFMNPAKLIVVILLVVPICFILTAAATEIRILKNIEVISINNTSQVRLNFDGNFNRNPLINFDTGSISLRLDYSKIDSDLPLVSIPESNYIIKDVRAVQVPDSNAIRLDILHNPSQFSLDSPKINYNENSLFIILTGKKRSNSALSITTELTNEIFKRVKSDSSFPSTFSKVDLSYPNSEQKNEVFTMPAQDWVETIVTLVFALVFVLLLIYLIAYIYNRFFSGKFSIMHGNINIRQVSSYHVGPKQKIIVFKMNERLFACGVTPSSINLIAELNDEDDQDFLASAQTEENSNQIDMELMQSNFLKSQDQKNQKNNDNKDQIEMKDDDSSISMNLKGQDDGVFLKKKLTEKKIATKAKISKVNSPDTKKSSFLREMEKSEKNQRMHDFTKKLSERIKLLKPFR